MADEKKHGDASARAGTEDTKSSAAPGASSGHAAKMHLKLTHGTYLCDGKMHASGGSRESERFVTVGETFEVDAAEAARLIEMKVAEKA